MLLLDASVIFSGLVGPGDGPSATLLATVRLGGFEACTTENAMEETRRRLLSWDNRRRSKLSFAKVDRDLKALREAPTFTVHPWQTAAASLFPENPKDAYLLAAMVAYRPRFLLTWDKDLLNLEVYNGVVIATPILLLTTIDELDAQP